MDLFLCIKYIELLKNLCNLSCVHTVCYRVSHIKLDRVYLKIVILGTNQKEKINHF